MNLRALWFAIITLISASGYGHILKEIKSKRDMEIYDPYLTHHLSSPREPLLNPLFSEPSKDVTRPIQEIEGWIDELASPRLKLAISILKFFLLINPSPMHGSQV